MHTDLVDLIAGERRIGRHQKVAPRRRDERRDDAHEVVVHVPRIAQRLRARSHHRRHLHDVSPLHARHNEGTLTS